MTARQSPPAAGGSVPLKGDTRGRDTGRLSRAGRLRLALVIAAWVGILSLAQPLVAPQPAQAATCTISWNSAEGGDWTDTGLWEPNRIPGPSDDVCITRAGTYAVALKTDASVRSLQVGAAVTLDVQSLTNRTLTLAADSSNDGTITLRQVGGGCTSVTLRISGGTLTNRGALNLGAACGGAFFEGNLVNAGTVTAPGPHSATLRGAGATFTNSGDFAVNGLLQVTAGTFIQEGGALTIAGVSFVVSGTAALQLNGGTTGTATVLGSGETVGAPTVRGAALRFGNGSTVSGDVSVEETSTLTGDVPAGIRLFVNADNAPTTLTSATSFTSAGTIQLRQTGGSCRSSTLAISTGAVTNTGTLIFGDACGNAVLRGSLNNTGTVQVIGSHAAEFTGAGATSTNTGTFTVSALLTVTGTNAPSFRQNGGVLTVDAGASFVLAAGTVFEVNGGALAGTPTVTGSGTTTGAPTVRGGALRFGTGSGSIAGGIAVEESSTLAGDVPAGVRIWINADNTPTSLTAAAAFTNAGTIQLRQTGGGCRSATLAVTGGPLTNTGTLLIGNACGGAFLEGSLINAGTVIVPGTHASALRGAGTTYRNTGAGTFAIRPGAALRMDGAGASFTNAGLFEIGAGSQFTAPGGGSFINEATGTLAFNIAGRSSFGRISMPGTVTLAGSANPAVQSGFVPTTGQRFQVITAPHGASCFTSIQQGFTADCSNTATVTLVAGNGNPLSVTTATLPAGMIGQAYPATTLTATGGTAPYTWAMAAGSVLPAGLTLSAAGILSGTPTAAGATTLTVQVMDAANPAQSATRQLAITIAAPPLSVTTTSLPNGTAGTAYPATALTAAGGTPPYTWSVSAGALPPGLTLSSAGTISGTPTAPGTATFTVRAGDAGNPAQAATRQLAISVAPAPLAVTTAALPDGMAGTAYPATTLTAAGGIAPYVWSLAAGSSLPGGLSLSAAGTITGVPSAAGTTTFTVRAADAGNPAQTATRQLSITIAPAAPAPLAINTSSLPTAPTGQPYPPTTLTAAGGTPPYTWALANGSALPPGLSLSAAGVIIGTPTTAGTITFTVRVTDIGNPVQIATRQLTITINLATAVRAYVANPNGLSLSVIDGATYDILGSVAVDQPYDVAASADGTRLYAASRTPGAASGSVTVIDTATTSVIRKIPMNGWPGEIAVWPAPGVPVPQGQGEPRVYVTDPRNGQLLVIDGTTNEVVNTITLRSGGVPYSVVVSSDGGTVYVGEAYGGRVYVIDATTGRVSTSFSAGTPYLLGLALHPDGRRLYAWRWVIGSEVRGDLVVLDTTTQQVTTTIPLSGAIAAFPAISPDGSRVYIYDNHQSAILVIDTATSQIVRSIATPHHVSYITISPDGSQIYASHGTWSFFGRSANTPTPGDRVFVFDAAGGQLLRTISMGLQGSTGIALIELSSSAPPPPRTPPTFLSAQLPQGFVGRAYGGVLSVSGGTRPFTWTVTSGSLPVGLTLNQTTGAITGTPTQEGASHFTLMVTDALSPPQRASVRTSITVTRPVIRVIPERLPDARCGTPYTVTLSATGAIGPLTYAVTDGATPAIRLEPNGVLTLFCASAGTGDGNNQPPITFRFTITATDGFGNTGSVTLTLTVYPRFG